MITVLGASGFIGRHLNERLGELNLERYAPARDEDLTVKPLGHVIYCIGLTADFRSRPLATVDAHVCKLLEVLQSCEFESLTYLSSTRLYANSSGPATEGNSLIVASQDPDDLYNISKAMGESLALHCGRKARVVRLSNVYGYDFDSENFLPAIIKDAVGTGKLTLYTAPDSTKDYVSISDVVDILIEISSRGRQAIYNLAAGRNVTNRELARRIREATNCTVEFAPDAPQVVFPSINIDRIRAEFDFRPRAVLDDLDDLVSSFRNQNRQ